MCMSVLHAFDLIVMESYSDCDTCAVKMRESESIKVRHIPRNASRIGTRSGRAVRGRARSARKLMSHTRLCAAGTHTLIRPDIQPDVC